MFFLETMNSRSLGIHWLNSVLVWISPFVIFVNWLNAGSWGAVCSQDIPDVPCDKSSTFYCSYFCKAAGDNVISVACHPEINRNLTYCTCFYNCWIEGIIKLIIQIKKLFLQSKLDVHFPFFVNLFLTICFIFCSCLLKVIERGKVMLKCWVSAHKLLFYDLWSICVIISTNLVELVPWLNCYHKFFVDIMLLF